VEEENETFSVKVELGGANSKCLKFNEADLKLTAGKEDCKEKDKGTYTIKITLTDV
jgi:hypothetical protein